MTIFTSTTQPFCRCCGKAITKHGNIVQVHRHQQDWHRNTNWSRYAYSETDVLTKDDCTRLTNKKVISLRYGKARNENGNTIEGTRVVTQFTEWDGETYFGQSEFFCSTTCAQHFGIACARKGMNTDAWRAANAKATDKLLADRAQAGAVANG